jgi:hypothetical protein
VTVAYVPRWGDSHTHDGVPVHPGCYGCQSCFRCTTNPESPCYVRLTEEELAAIPPAVVDDSDPFEGG